MAKPKKKVPKKKIIKKVLKKHHKEIVEETESLANIGLVILAIVALVTTGRNVVAA